jgi:hypothetical protein
LVRVVAAVEGGVFQSLAAVPEGVYSMGMR